MGHIAEKSWSSYKDYLMSCEPDNPVMFFSPAEVHSAVRQFLESFPGLVTYAVKANTNREMLEAVMTAGVRGFDCASIAEINLIRSKAPDAMIHYNNPVRSRREVEQSVALGIKSYSLDSASEMAKLMELIPSDRVRGTELSVRFKLNQGSPAEGIGYDLNTKFGASVDAAVMLLKRVASAGFVPSLTFHPGTQCTDPSIWVPFVQAAAEISRRAEVTIARLNVGGGFPNYRNSGCFPRLVEIFQTIDRAVDDAFVQGLGGHRPQLVCEPGRALCGDAYTVAARVKSVRDGNHIFLNDGMFGTMAEFRFMGTIDRIKILSPDGKERRGEQTPRVVFGPTCDSVDRFPGNTMLPCDIQEEDYFVIMGMGAYSIATNSTFNGYGKVDLVVVESKLMD